MDLNLDGYVDILSGSYSRQTDAMAGLFQVLWGGEKRSFEAASVLDGSDGQELIITAPKKDLTAVICTRPTAVDLDGDGNVDIVSGNFGGTFAFFKGEGVVEGSVKFAPRSTWLKDSSGTKLKVTAHSDPFFVDWDADGDLDMLSGTSEGGVVLFKNSGNRTEPKFEKAKFLVKASGMGSRSNPKIGQAHLRGAQGSTRVWCDDIDGDGKLDLLVGDSVTLYAPAKGYTEASMRKALAKWTEANNKLGVRWSELTAEGQEPDRAELTKLNKAMSASFKSRKKFITEDPTGFVWVYRRK